MEELRYRIRQSDVQSNSVVIGCDQKTAAAAIEICLRLCGQINPLASDISEIMRKVDAGKDNEETIVCTGRRASLFYSIERFVV